MILADDAKRFGLDRPGARDHGIEQTLDCRTIDRAAVAQPHERRSLQAGRSEHRLLLQAAAQPAELRDELADRPLAAALEIMREVGRDQALEMLGRVPVRAGGVRRPPLCHAGSVARMAERSPNQVTVRARCGLSQV